MILQTTTQAAESTAASGKEKNSRGLYITVYCCIAYSFCYILRNILSAFMPTILQSGDFTEKQLGTFGSVLLACYACGQFVNGFLGDRIKAKNMIATGLFLAGLCAFLFGLPAFGRLGALLWAVIGFSLSMLWGPITRVIVETSGEVRASLYLALAGTGAYLGMFLAYFLAILAARHGVWRVYFLAGGATVCVAAVAFWIIFSLLVRTQEKAAPAPGAQAAAPRMSLRNTVFLQKPFFIMLVAVMLNGVIKHAVSYWIPTYFADRLALGTGIASVISSVIPMIGIGTSFFALLIYRWIRNDIKTLAVLFAASTGALLLVAVGGGTVWLPVLGMLLSNTAMGIGNSVIFNMYCLRFRKTGCVSGVTGLLDSSCYGASAAANLLFTRLIAGAGWGATVLVWLLFSALGVAVSLCAMRAYRD